MSSALVSLLFDLTGPPTSVVELGINPGPLLDEVQRQALEYSASLIQVSAVSIDDKLPPPERVSLVFCLEGADSLSSKSALELVQWLTSSADVVVFSAAWPGQLGFDCINCQPTLYWADLFELFDFCRFDILRQRLLRDSATPWQQRQNVTLYARRNSSAECQLRSRHLEDFLPQEFELVHHTMITKAFLYHAAKPLTPSVHTLIRSVPLAVGKSIHFRASEIAKKFSTFRFY